MITFDKLIKNFENFEKNGCKLIKNEIYKLFEPIIYQVVLTTRMDSGTGRASVGYEFATKILPSQRILDAIEYDMTENRSAYHFWANSFGIKDPRQDYLGTAKALVDGKKIVVTIDINDQGVVNQNNGEFPSTIHPRPNPGRHFPYHIREIMAVVDNVNLENFNGSGIYLTSVAQDIRYNMQELYKKVEGVLFK